jgi:hypothetical protein
MTSNEIRSSFLKFFEERGHRIVLSSPLVPGDDPTSLFTNAGMNQFKDALLGREKRDHARDHGAEDHACVSAAQRPDNVGPSHRHHTFFEMLGNFLVRRLFKGRKLPFAWELLTGVEDAEGQVRRCRSSRARRASRDDEGVRSGGSWEFRRPHPRAQRGRQLLVDGRYRPLRPLLEIYFVRGGSGMSTRRSSSGTTCSWSSSGARAES